MHELSIATALMDQIVDEALSHQLTIVDKVELHTGFLRQVIPEMMQEAFREVSAGTLADGATLTIKEIPAEVKCRSCDKLFEPELDCFLCPSCHKADVEILQGNNIILASIQGE